MLLQIDQERKHGEYVGKKMWKVELKVDGHSTKRWI